MGSVGWPSSSLSGSYLNWTSRSSAAQSCVEIAEHMRKSSTQATRTDPEAVCTNDPGCDSMGIQPLFLRTVERTFPQCTRFGMTTQCPQQATNGNRPLRPRPIATDEPRRWPPRFRENDACRNAPSSANKCLEVCLLLVA